MGALDQVMQLKQQGMDDQAIMNNLQQQGISPKEITDAMNQAQIKNAVSDNPGAGNPAEGAVPSPETGAPTPTQAAQPAGEGYYTPQTQEMGGYDQGAAQPAEYYEEGAYDQGYGQQAAPAMDSDTIIEIANQVFSEKIKKMQTQVDEITELKTVMQVKVDHIDERLKRIEKIIDTLQIKVLEKVGSFGTQLNATRKEVSMVENSLGKLAKTKTKSTTKKTSSKKK